MQGFIFQGLISEKECLKGNHVAFDEYMTYLEDNHPRERTRLSKQTWLRVTGSTDLVLKDLQRRQEKCSTIHYVKNYFLS